jgi:hypothetical protein
MFSQKLIDASTHWLLSEPNTADATPLCDFGRLSYEIRPGDVILVEGRSRVSNVVCFVTNSPWTHTALYVGRLNDIQDEELRNDLAQRSNHDYQTQWIIESMLGQGTLLTPLEQYQKEHIRICRPNQISHTDAQHVIRYALRQVGVQYDVRHIFDLARFLLPWHIMPRRWRSSLFHFHPGKHTRTICSTLIAQAFMSVRYPILPIIKRNKDSKMTVFHRNPQLFIPKDFDYSPYFEIIKYPFVNISESMYRKLPWETEPVICNDENDCFIPSFDEAPEKVTA